MAIAKTGEAPLQVLQAEVVRHHHHLRRLEDYHDLHHLTQLHPPHSRRR